MNKRVISLALAGIIATVTFGYVHAVPQKKDTKLPKQHILAQEQADVNGDKIKDTIYLMGEKIDEDYMFFDKIYLKVIDGKNKKELKSDVKTLGGVEGKLYLRDFTGDKVLDIMVVSPTGGSGGTVTSMISTVKDNTLKQIFGDKEGNGLQFKGQFVDGFKAKLKSDVLNKDVEIDLSAFKNMYIEQKIYDKNGKVLQKIEPWTDAYSKLEPVDYCLDGVFELKGIQKISGSCHADTISELENILKFEDGKWVIKQSKISTFLHVE